MDYTYITGSPETLTVAAELYGIDSVISIGTNGYGMISLPIDDVITFRELTNWS